MTSEKPKRPTSAAKATGKRPSTSKLDTKSILSIKGNDDPECADSRRVAMLKCQMIQLERQLLVLTDIAGQRKDLLLQTSDSLSKLIDMCRKGIARAGHSPEVPMKRADLISIVEKARFLQGSLIVQHDNTLNDKVPQTGLTPYNKYTTDTAPKTDAKTSGRTLAASIKEFSTLNLSEVSLLEGSLSDLRGRLIGMSSFMNAAFTKSWMPPDFADHYDSLLRDVLHRLEECTSELLELSLLVPVYPTTIRKKTLAPTQEREDKSEAADLEFRRLVSEIKSETLRLSVENKTRQLEQESTLLKAEIAALQKELTFHTKIYDKQTTYCESLIRGMRKGYGLLQQSVRTSFVDSLNPVLAAYGRMEKHPSEVSLREFLDNCRTWLPVVKDAVDNLEGQLDEQGHHEDKIFDEFNRLLVEKVKGSRETSSPQLSASASGTW